MAGTEGKTLLVREKSKTCAGFGFSGHKATEQGLTFSYFNPNGFGVFCHWPYQNSEDTEILFMKLSLWTMSVMDWGAQAAPQV